MTTSPTHQRILNILATQDHDYSNFQAGEINRRLEFSQQEAQQRMRELNQQVEMNRQHLNTLKYYHQMSLQAQG